MSRRAIELTFVAAVAFVEAGLALAVILTSDHSASKHVQTALAVTAGLSFVFTGLVALHRRPENRTGLYLAGVGFLWFFGALQDANGSILFTIGELVGSLVFVPFAALVLSYPSGGSTGQDVRSSGPRSGSWSSGRSRCCSTRPRRVAPAAVPTARSSSTSLPGLAHVLDFLDALVPVGLCAAAVVILIRKWRVGDRAGPEGSAPRLRERRRSVAAAPARESPLGRSPRATNAVFSFLFVLFFAAVPFAFLFGILQSRLARGSVAGLMVSLEHGRPLRAAIADALGDPSLGLAFWLERRRPVGRPDGRPLDLSLVPDQAITVVERDGAGSPRSSMTSRSAASPSWSRAYAAAVAFALDNERLQAELRMQNERCSP